MKRQIKFSIKDNAGTEITLSMKIPTGGQLVQIENIKALTSGNNYRGMVSTNSIGSDHALDLIDMNAYFSVLCPEILEHLKVNSLLELDIFDLSMVKVVFNDQITPWINEWQTKLREVSKEKSLISPTDAKEITKVSTPPRTAQITKIKHQEGPNT